MVYFLFTLLILPTLVTATPSKIFTHANDGAVLAGHPTLTCQSADCYAIQTHNIDNCMTYTCRAIVGDSEYACPYWDCNVVIYARKHGPLPRALAEALCVTPNCIAMATQNPSEAQDIDGMVMTQFNRETGLGSVSHEDVKSLIQAWQASTYYDPNNLKKSFHLFAIQGATERERKWSETLLKHIEPMTYPTCISINSPFYPGNDKKKTRECRTCTIL